MDRVILVRISEEKQSPESFMVALVNGLAFPEGVKVWKGSTGMSVQGINHDEDNVWSYIHLHADEKQAVGNELMTIGAELDKWYWCQMFDNLK